MSASAVCHHPETVITACPTHYQAEGIVLLTVMVSCATCNARFRFRGSPANPNPDAPAISDDGFIAALPMVEVCAEQARPV